MPVTLRLPTVLAKSAGGQTVHQAKGATVVTAQPEIESISEQREFAKAA